MCYMMCWSGAVVPTLTVRISAGYFERRKKMKPLHSAGRARLCQFVWCMERGLRVKDRGKTRGKWGERVQMDKS